MPCARVAGVAIGVLVLEVGGCATMEEKPQVAIVETKPQVSKVIQEAPKETVRQLKRKVAIARFSNETKIWKRRYTRSQRCLPNG